MQRVTIVRYTAKPERADENETLSRAVFAELNAKTPGPLSYLVFRDGQDFLHVYINFQDGDEGGIVDLPTFKAFTKDGSDRWVGAADVQRRDMQLIGAYGVEAALAPA